jgi:hypothetical protein
MDRRIETVTPTGITIVENRYGSGFTEIGVYRPPVILGAGKILTCVVSRQVSKGKWVVHTPASNRAFLSKVKRRAVEYAVAHADKLRAAA